MLPINPQSLWSPLQPAVVHLQGQGSAIQVKNGKDLMALAVVNRARPAAVASCPGRGPCCNAGSLAVPAGGLSDSPAQTPAEEPSAQCPSPFLLRSWR